MSKMRSIADDSDYVDGEITSDLNASKDDDECSNRNANLNDDRNDSIDNNKFQMHLNDMAGHDKVGKSKNPNGDINEMDSHEPELENDHEEIESKFGERFFFVFGLFSIECGKLMK